MRRRKGIVFLDEQPFVFFSLLQPHQGKLAVEFRALENNGEAPFLQPLFENALVFFAVLDSSGLVGSLVPEHYRPGSVVPFRNDSLEPSIIQRMIFDHDRQALFLGIEGRAFGNRPAFECSAEL